MNRREQKAARRRRRLETGRRSPGWQSRRRLAAAVKVEAMAMNDDFLGKRMRQSKRFDDAHAKDRRARGVQSRPERWHPGTPKKLPQSRKGKTWPAVGSGRPIR